MAVAAVAVQMVLKIFCLRFPYPTDGLGNATIGTTLEDGWKKIRFVGGTEWSFQRSADNVVLGSG